MCVGAERFAFTELQKVARVWSLSLSAFLFPLFSLIFLLSMLLHPLASEMTAEGCIAAGADGSEVGEGLCAKRSVGARASRAEGGAGFFGEEGEALSSAVLYFYLTSLFSIGTL